MSFYDHLRNQGIADRLTGFPPAPGTTNAPSVESILPLMRKASWTVEEVRDAVQLLASKMTKESVIGLLDQCADDLSDEIHVPHNPVLDGTVEELNAIVLEQWK